jgi:3-isopropylmalate dehydrogenase
MSPPRIALVHDGAGSALLACARAALEAVAGTAITEPSVSDARAIRESDAALAERPLAGLARALGHDVGLLAVRALPLLARAGPLRDRRAARTDLLIVRGLAGAAAATAEAAAAAAERIARAAFDAADRRAGRLAVVARADADDVAARAWREAIERVAPAAPDVAVEHIADAEAAAELVASPWRFDVVACDAPAGNALSGAAVAITGTAPMLAAATVGARPPGLFTPHRPPAHGAAAGGTANPLPAVLAAALLLREGLGMEAEAERLDVAVEMVLETGLRTPDLVLGDVGERRAGTQALSAALLSQLGRGLG